MEVTTSSGKQAFSMHKGAALGGSATTRACARLTDGACSVPRQPVEVRQREGVTWTTFDPESCAESL